MPRTELSVQDIVRTGLTPSFEAAETDGEAIDNSSHKVFIHVKNTNAASITVDIITPGTIDGMAIPDKQVTVPATTGDKMIGPFPAGLYDQNDTTLGIAKAVHIDFSAVTDVTIAAIKLPDPTY